MSLLDCTQEELTWGRGWGGRWVGRGWRVRVLRSTWEKYLQQQRYAVQNNMNVRDDGGGGLPNIKRYPQQNTPQIQFKIIAHARLVRG